MGPVLIDKCIEFISLSASAANLANTSCKIASDKHDSFNFYLSVLKQSPFLLWTRYVMQKCKCLHWSTSVEYPKVSCQTEDGCTEALVMCKCCCWGVHYRIFWTSTQSKSCDTNCWGLIDRIWLCCLACHWHTFCCCTLQHYCILRKYISFALMSITPGMLWFTLWL